MDKKIVFGNVGVILRYLGFLMIIPIGVALYYGEATYPFLVSFAITTSFGLILERLVGKRGEIKRTEGFAIVALSWLFVAIFGTFPYILSSTLGPIDAFFESMSGFTTTGSTVIIGLEDTSRSILLWRSFTQWIGGMGVILLFIAILPAFGVAGSQLFDREFPGPMSERIRPRIQETARMLWSIYLILTFVEVLLLLFVAKMPLFHSFCTTFSTMPTGGFSPLTKNIGGYMNPIAEFIIMIFMFLAGMNFVLHYSLLSDRKRILKNKEFQVYCAIILVSILIITMDLWIHKFPLLESMRYGAFQGISIMTTTGFTTSNFNTWSHLSKIVLFVLMFIGGCGGSTGGAIKVIRIWVLLKYISRRIRQILHPKAIWVVKVGKPISEDTLQGITAFILLYLLIFVICSIAMGTMLDPTSAASSVAATLGNVGPGFGLVATDYSSVPIIGKIILSFCMWVGRLEIFAVLMLLIPEFWR